MPNDVATRENAHEKDHPTPREDAGQDADEEASEEGGEADGTDASSSGAMQMIVPERVRVDAKRALIGGGLAAGVTLLGAWLVGEASGAEARILLETALPRARTFCGTVTIALGNVLALMLTLLSLSTGADVDLKWGHYQRVKQVAFIDAFTLIAAVLIYLLLNIPLTDADAAQGSNGWYAGLYYAVLALTSLLGGALISVVLMLYNTVRDLIRAVGPDRESTLVRQEEEEEA
jgi:uncharacterized membrane protein YozB (DUF420 family)